MADQFKVMSRIYDPWCHHDNNRTSDCRPCWKRVKRWQRRKGRKRLARLDLKEAA